MEKKVLLKLQSNGTTQVAFSHRVATVSRHKKKPLMRWMARVSVALMVGLLAACSNGQRSSNADHGRTGLLNKVGIFTVNYSDFEIGAVLVKSQDAKDVGFGGPIPPLAMGGVGPAACCYQLPRPGEQITIYWTNQSMGNRFIKRTIVLTGSVPDDPSHFSNLIIRFMNDFPAATIQAEFISDDEIKAGRPSTHIDPLPWPVLDKLTQKQGG
jgi:hypothetical protein